MNKLRSKKGFTLIELVVVMVIIGILAIIAVPIYNQYRINAMTSEGRTLAAAIANSERAYYVKAASIFAAPNGSTNDTTLGISCGQNTYYTSFQTAANTAPGFIVTCYPVGGLGLSNVVYTQPSVGAPTVTP